MSTLTLNGRARSFAVTFFDCDGVIFDSNRAKLTVFERTLAGYPEPAVERLLQLHRERGGVSRYAKLERFFTELHPVEDPGQAVAAALERFGAHSSAAYAQLEPRPEALALAEHMGGADAVHVVSGADQAELRRVFSAHGIRDRFREILGSPEKKPAHMRRVLQREGVDASRALMIGDGIADFEACRELGVTFLFLEEMSDWADARAVLAGAPDTHVFETWAALISARNPRTA